MRIRYFRKTLTEQQEGNIIFMVKALKMGHVISIGANFNFSWGGLFLSNWYASHYLLQILELAITAEPQ